MVQFLPVGDDATDRPLEKDEIAALRALKAVMRDVPSAASAIIKEMSRKDRAILQFHLQELSSSIDDQQLRDRTY